MAGDWIKMRGNLWDDPRIGSICDATGVTEAAVIGALYWLWSAADQHTEDGIMPGLSIRQIDRKTGLSGFGAALCDIGWLVDHPEGVRIVKFEEHNGTSAKRRCTEAQRKAKVRTSSAVNADNAETKSGGCAELEKEREEELKNTLVDGTPSTPVCPHQEIIDMYHEHCPTLATVKVWHDTRRKHLQARWREDVKRQSLDYWERFFRYVAQSPFLTGNPGPWKADLEWLVNSSNFVKVIEGKYHQESAA